jgi:hypothetical protein
MSDSNRQPGGGRNALGVFLSVLILFAILGGGYFILQTMRDVTAPLRSVQQANDSLQTQVAQLLHPTPTILPDPVTYIQEVRALARLETIQYSVEKVITAEQGQGLFSFLTGDKLLFVAHGIVIAGIDMEKLTPKDLRLEDGVLYVTLPAPEVFIATLDNDKSYVYDRETGLLTKGNVDLETLARQAAEDEIRKAALEDGILDQASTNAQSYLMKFFTALGYRTVFFEDLG